MIPLLSIQNLNVDFKLKNRNLRAVDQVSFDLQEGTTLGIVGESGSGKSTCCLSILNLLPQPTGTIESGSILYKQGDKILDLTQLPQVQMRKIRGKEIAMIFQDPMSSLNPVFSIKNQISEVLHLHEPQLTKNDITNRTIELLESVGINQAKIRMNDFPHQFSGGMRQRVMIAMALACTPKILIADEPTSSLDATVQFQILELLNRLQDKLGLSIILITHDLGVIAQMAKNVVVMYAGQVIEHAPVHTLFKNSKHPYTRGLLGSVPTLEKVRRLTTIPGIVPNLLEIGQGCRFAKRCSYAVDNCSKSTPEFNIESPEHRFRCIRKNIF